MFLSTVTSDIRIINVASTASATLLSTLINVRLETLSKSLPQSQILQVAITPSADIEVRDGDFGDAVIVQSGTRRVYPVESIHDKITLKNSATVNVEIFFSRGL